jgi:hypothetical protein
MTELAYALVQMLHNLGAVAVVAGPAGALLPAFGGALAQRRFALLILAAWGLQAASGAGFALTSYAGKGQLPEVTGVALVALVLKVSCTAVGLGLAAAASRERGRRWSGRARSAVWGVSLGLALVALSSAALLRWYL